MKKGILYSIAALTSCYSCVSIKKEANPYKTNYSLKYVMKVNDSVIREDFNYYITQSGASVPKSSASVPTDHLCLLIPPDCIGN